jgi:hypothetical protein
VDLKDLKARLAQLGLRVSRDLLDLVAYLVQMEPRDLVALQERLDQKVLLDRRASRGKLAPEVRLVQKAIGASLVLQALLGQLDPRD